MSQTWNLPIVATETTRLAAITSIIPDALEALRTQHAGATAPAAPVAYMIWADTAAGLIKVRNAANSAWLVLGSLVERWDYVELSEPFANVSATFTLAPFTVPQSARIEEVVLVSNTATAGSDGTNRYRFNVVNVTQSSVSLFSTLPATNGAEVTANTAYVMAPNQNQNVAKNDVLAFTLTKDGTGPATTDWTAAKARLQIRGFSR